MKIRGVGAELLHAHTQTGRHTTMTKVTRAFRNFTTAPKNYI
jgi:hypothetical protein